MNQTQRALLLVAAKRAARSGEGAQLRADAGLSLAEMSSALGVSVSTVFRWEHGTEPHGDRAVAWAELLQLLRQGVGAAS